MAWTTNNPLLKHVRGKLGGTIVYRTYNGKVVISKSPTRPTTESEGQRENRARFRDASTLAREATNDRELRAYFLTDARRRRLPNAYTAALSFYRRLIKTGGKLMPTPVFEGEQEPLDPIVARAVALYDNYTPVTPQPAKSKTIRSVQIRSVMECLRELGQAIVFSFTRWWYGATV